MVIFIRNKKIRLKFIFKKKEYLKTLNEKDVANSDVITTTCSDGGTLTNESLQGIIQMNDKVKCFMY